MSDHQAAKYCVTKETPRGLEVVATNLDKDKAEKVCQESSQSGGKASVSQQTGW